MVRSFQATKYSILFIILAISLGVYIIKFVEDDSRVFSIIVDDREYTLRIPRSYILHVTRYGNPEVGEIALLVKNPTKLNINEFDDANISYPLKFFVRLRSTQTLYKEMLKSRLSRPEFSNTIFQSNDIIVMGGNGGATNLSEVLSISDQLIIMYGNFKGEFQVQSYMTCWPRLYEDRSVGKCEAHLDTDNGINIRYYVPFTKMNKLDLYSTFVRHAINSFLGNLENNNELR